MHIFSEISLWFIPLCLLIGIGLAYVLYRKKFQLTDVPRRTVILLFCLRAFSMSLVCALLLHIFIDIRSTTIEKPTIVFVHDNSASISMHADSNFYRSEYPNKIRELCNDLRKNYKVAFYQFGEQFSHDTTLNFTDRQTNISHAFQEIQQRYANKNVGAIILASDGIYNTGENPLYTLKNTGITEPVYSIALGDSAQQRDNVIQMVLANNIAFKNVPFRILIQTQSFNLQGKTSKVLVFNGSQKLFETTIKARSSAEFNEIPCTVTAHKAGQMVYRVVIETHEGEVNRINNEYTFSVEVLDSQRKIALLYETPHPDIAALHRAIQTNENFDITLSSIDQWKGNMQDYNAVILHGAPSTSAHSTAVFEQIIHHKIPLLLVYNSTTSLTQLSALGLFINRQNQQSDEVQARFNADFDIFEMSEEHTTVLQNCPPLIVPYATITVQNPIKTVAFQNVAGVETSKELLFVGENDTQKFAVIMGEGVWRWRLQAFRQSNSFDAFDVLVNKIVSYLSLTQKRDVFSVQSKRLFYENQQIQMQAQLFNKSFEPVSGKQISIVIRNAGGNEFPFICIENNGLYELNAGNFAPGAYTFTAQTTLDNETLTRKGSFTVLPLHIEFRQTRANHALLQQLAQQNGGEVFFPNTMSKLSQAIEQNNSVVSIMHSTTKRRSLLDITVLLIALIANLSAEWAIRKYQGAY
ncbi:MAG: hypothetical protein LBM68_05085 [Bacteroidales bacterium]|jgi:hypothetical protein|nr:hypothetical protein [Bacteroidales bacterium]